MGGVGREGLGEKLFALLLYGSVHKEGKGSSVFMHLLRSCQKGLLSWASLHVQCSEEDHPHSRGGSRVAVIVEAGQSARVPGSRP